MKRSFSTLEIDVVLPSTTNKRGRIWNEVILSEAEATALDDVAYEKLSNDTLTTRIAESWTLIDKEDKMKSAQFPNDFAYLQKRLQLFWNDLEVENTAVQNRIHQNYMSNKDVKSLESSNLSEYNSGVLWPQVQRLQKWLDEQNIFIYIKRIHLTMLQIRDVEHTEIVTDILTLLREECTAVSGTDLVRCEDEGNVKIDTLLLEALHDYQLKQIYRIVVKHVEDIEVHIKKMKIADELSLLLQEAFRAGGEKVRHRFLKVVNRSSRKNTSEMWVRARQHSDVMKVNLYKMAHSTVIVANIKAMCKRVEKKSVRVSKEARRQLYIQECREKCLNDGWYRSFGTDGTVWFYHSVSKKLVGECPIENWRE
jgi:hypothetical protein